MTNPPSPPMAARVALSFLGYWLAGTGLSRGRDVDETAYRDRFGCPAMPMTQVKGTLKDEARSLAQANQGGWTTGHVEALFGTVEQEGSLIFSGDAALPQGVREWFERHPRARSQLFRRIPATMIGDLGAAESRTLRMTEVVVPMTVSGRIMWRGPEAPNFDWVYLLDAACATAMAFGKLKFDGFGRVIARCDASMESVAA